MAGAFALLGLAAGCAPSQGPPTRQAVAQESARADALVKELRQRGMLIEDPALNRYVGGIVERIDAQRPRGLPPLRHHIIADASANAFTPGGGAVFFNAGLISAMENEAQFAMVAAHEVAHIDRGHVQAAQQVRSNAGLAAVGGILAGALLGVDPGVTQELAQLGYSGFTASYSRSQEEDADTLGFRYLADAGWNAAAGARSFAVLRRLYGEQTGAAAFFSSHPLSSERQARISRLAQQQGANRGRVAQEEWLRRTNGLRREVLDFLQDAGRDREAAQARRNIRALR